jgi:hypothetical protein
MPSEIKSPLQLVESLLNDQSYHIEFNGFLSNHAKHAVIALYRLGASEKTIEAYYNAHAECTPYGYGLEPRRPSQNIITQDNWQVYFGRHRNFTAYCQFFDQKEKELGMKQTLSEFVPILLPGCVGSLMHGTIHLGWALDSGNRWMTIEGLSYMAFSYMPCNIDKTFPATHSSASDNSVLNSLLHTADAWQADREALCNWLETTLASKKYSSSAGFHPELAVTGTQYDIAKILTEGHPLIHATPAWIDNEDLQTIWEQLHEAVTLLYMASPGDFFVLHLITSLHAIEQISNQLPLDQQKRAIKCYWTAMLGILFSLGEFPNRATLEALHSQYKDAVDEDVKLTEEQKWKPIIARALAEKEEHNPKLIYVLRRMWKRFRHQSIFRIAAGHFTTTPEVTRLGNGVDLSIDLLD